MYSSFHMSLRAIPIKSAYPTSAIPTACSTFENNNTRVDHSPSDAQMLILKYGVDSDMMYLMFNR